MRKHWILAGVVVVALLAATVGIAYAAGSGGGGASGDWNMSLDRQAVAGCDTMHESTVMQAMHDRMPAALQAQCDAMHEQVEGMMGGSGMMGGGSMASHHPSTEGASGT